MCAAKHQKRTSYILPGKNASTAEVALPGRDASTKDLPSREIVELS